MPALDDLIDRDDYEPGAPSRLAAVFDRRAVAGTHCANCGSTRLCYRPFRRRDGSGYRAFAVCARCEHAEEF